MQKVHSIHLSLYRLPPSELKRHFLGEKPRVGPLLDTLTLTVSNKQVGLLYLALKHRKRTGLLKSFEKVAARLLKHRVKGAQVTAFLIRMQIEGTDTKTEFVHVYLDLGEPREYYAGVYHLAEDLMRKVNALVQTHWCRIGYRPTRKARHLKFRDKEVWKDSKAIKLCIYRYFDRAVRIEVNPEYRKSLLDNKAAVRILRQLVKHQPQYVWYSVTTPDQLLELQLLLGSGSVHEL